MKKLQCSRTCSMRMQNGWKKLAIMFTKAFYFLTLIVFQDGVYIKGLYLQGAGWDKKNACLIEAEPMQLVCPIPTIHFKPVESKKRSQRGKNNPLQPNL